MNIIMNEKRRATLSLATSLLSMGIHLMINFFLSPYIVSNFGEEANGFAQLASNFVNYATLLTVALNSMAGRFITVSYYQKDYKKCEKYYSSVLIGNIFIILLLTARFLARQTICALKSRALTAIAITSLPFTTNIIIRQTF